MAVFFQKTANQMMRASIRFRFSSYTAEQRQIGRKRSRPGGTEHRHKEYGMIPPWSKRLISALNTLAIGTRMGTTWTSLLGSRTNGKTLYRIFQAYGPNGIGRMAMLGSFVNDLGGSIRAFYLHSMGPYFNASMEVAARKDNMARLINATSRSALFQTSSPTAVCSKPIVTCKRHYSRWTYELTAVDHKGMVRSIGELTSRFQFNISHAQGFVYSEPHSARQWFTMKIVIEVPESGRDDLRNFSLRLIQLRPQHMVKVHGPSSGTQVEAPFGMGWAGVPPTRLAYPDNN